MVDNEVTRALIDAARDVHEGWPYWSHTFRTAWEMLRCSVTWWKGRDPDGERG